MQTYHSRKFVVDCEFNYDTNELISIAIVPLWTNSQLPHHRVQEEPEREFYAVLSPLPANPSEFVRKHVLNCLGAEGQPIQLVQERLEAFFVANQIEELHYDWCDDIAYVNRLMMTGPGQRIKLGGRFLSHIHHPFMPDGATTHHNALDDARQIAANVRERVYSLA